MAFKRPFFQLSITVTPVYLSLSADIFGWIAGFEIGYFPSRDYGRRFIFSDRLWIFWIPDYKHINWVLNAYGYHLSVWNGTSHGLIKLK